jgi:hypothetical protein
MDDPSSKREAREFVESCMPDANIRRRYLSILADAIREVDLCAEKQWAVTVKPKLRLVVGHYWTYTLWTDEVVWLALDSDNYNAAIQSGQLSHDSFARGMYDPNDIPRYKDRKNRLFSTNLYHNLRTADPTTWPIIEQLSFDFIVKAIDMGKRLDTKRTVNADGVLKYMRKYLNRTIPDPQFSRND